MSAVRHIDQMKREIWLPSFPKRIVSLVPSQTELLIDLGLQDRLVGRTQFCIHPAEILKDIPRIGGTKKLQLDAIRTLKPDLIIGNKEENQKEDIEALAAEYPIWMSDIQSIEDALQMIRTIGEITQTVERAYSIAEIIESDFSDIKAQKERFKDQAVLYAIWKNPWMFAGQDTFIHHVLELAGFQNACREIRYPEMEWKDIEKLEFDSLFLSSEPFPFAGKHEEEARALLPNKNIVLVDGEMFSWYGSRLLRLKNYLNELAHKMA